MAERSVVSVVSKVKIDARHVWLAFAGAVFMSLAAPPVSFWPVGLLAWLPLALVVASEDVAGATLAGWLQGALAQASVVAAVPGALHSVVKTPWPASIALYALLACFEGARQGLVALLATRAVKRGFPLWLALPVAISSAELVWPMLFPWTTSLFLSAAPILLQTAEIFGRLGISLWVGVLDAALAMASTRLGRPAFWVYAAVIPASLLGFVVAYGAWRMRGMDDLVATAHATRIAIVQGDIPDVRNDPRDPGVLYRDASIALLAHQEADLLIWPETAIFYVTDDQDLDRIVSDRILTGPMHDPEHALDPRLRIRVPLLTGMVLRRHAHASPARIRNADGTIPTEPARFTNSAVLVMPDGRVRGVYDKRSLVPLGEYIPGETQFPWLRSLVPWAGRFSPGNSSSPLVVEGKRILVSICYEDVLAEATREAVVQGHPDLLVNLTSDAWFDGSRIPYLHLELAKLRTIEHRRFLVHATNTGVTAVFDPAGRTAFLLPARQEAAGVARVAWMSGYTPYEAMGDVPLFVTTMLMLGMLFVPRRRP
ncbi:MAG: apolipoprotein N-acyltransferase [Polyangiaceae bacterium]